jgi:hypothetical protein
MTVAASFAPLETRLINLNAYDQTLSLSHAEQAALACAATCSSSLTTFAGSAAYTGG